MGWGSITSEANPITAFEDYTRSLSRKQFVNPRTIKRDNGGFWSASFGLIPESREDAIAFLNNGLGREVKFYKVVWFCHN
jgi:hypothetical protein